MIQVEVSGDTRERLRSWADEQLPALRQTAVRQTMRDTLDLTMQDHPVETGRARDAWLAALREVGGETFPALGGGGGGSNEGHARESHDTHQTEVQATNTVDYIGYLEYGTSRHPPFAMVRSALAVAKSFFSRHFQLRR